MERLTGETLARALQDRKPEALAQVRADMRARRELRSCEEVREVFGTDHFSRTVSIRAADVDLKTRQARLSFSSEEPYERWGWEGPYLEVLGHEAGEVDLDRLNAGGALLVNHDTADQVGAIREAEVGEDRMGRALVEFSQSERAREILTDVADGIRQNTSVGYIVERMILIEEREDGPDVYRVVRWSPLEVSIVPIPADPTVGVSRELELAGRQAATASQEGITMNPKEIQTARDEALATERERVAGITALGDQHDMGDLARELIADNTELDAARERFLTAIADGAGPPVRGGGKDDEIGLTPNEARSFSVLRAVRALFARHNFEGYGRADIDAAGFELECSKAVGQGLGQEAQGILIPMEVMRTPLEDPQARAAQALRMLVTGQRDLNVGTDSAGGYLVGTETLGMIPMLRNKALVLRLGATALGALNGDLAIPRQTGGATSYWVSEGNAPTESQQTLGQLALTPHTCGAYTDVTRKLIKQASIDAEAFVRDDLMQTIAIELDRVAIEGTGASGEPLGILNTSGIGVQGPETNGSAPDWDDIVGTFQEVAVDNADVGTLAWLTNAANAAKLMATAKGSSGDPPYIMERFGADGFGEIMGLRAGVSNNVPADLTQGTGTSLSALILGNMKDLVVAQWGTVDLTVDPFTHSNTGTLRIVALTDLDIGLRHPQSFAAKKDCITTL